MLRSILIFLLFGSATLRAQGVLSQVGDRFLFQGNYLLVDSGAGSVSLPNWHPYSFDADGGYVGALNRYGLSGLTECLIGLSKTSPVASMRWSGIAKGDGIFHQASAQFSLIRHLSARFRLGTSIGFTYLGISGYGSRWMPVGSVIAGGMVGHKMVWGFCWDNPQQLTLRKGLLSWSPMRIRFGMAYVLSSRLNIYSGMEWEPGAANGSVVRLAYRPSNVWRVDLGTGWRPDQIILAVHRRLKHGWMGVSFSQEMTLGSSIYFGYSWISKNNSAR